MLAPALLGAGRVRAAAVRLVEHPLRGGAGFGQPVVAGDFDRDGDGNDEILRHDATHAIHGKYAAKTHAWRWDDLPTL